METDLFATCCYVDIDMEEGFAWCVRAGHLPPVVRHPDGSTEIAETEGGPPLGVMTQADFPMSPLRLPARHAGRPHHGRPGRVRRGRHRRGHGPPSPAPVRGRPARLGLVADALLGNAPRSDDVALLLVRYDGMATRPLRESWDRVAGAQAVGHARRFTRRTLRSWGVTEDLDTALLVVSELVTNALVHTDGQVRLDIALVNDRLRLAVADASPRTPVQPTSIGWEAAAAAGHPPRRGRVGGLGALSGQRGKAGVGGVRPAAVTPAGPSSRFSSSSASGAEDAGFCPVTRLRSVPAASSAPTALRPAPAHRPR
ncbi:hypothetical protein SGRIM128S_06383 [Streptomyces griseomycini]